MSTKMLTLPEAASLLGKSERQVRYMIRQGTLSATKQGRRWLVPKTALEGQTGRRERQAAKLARLDGVVRDTLQLPEAGRPSWTVRTMRAVDAARRVYLAMGQAGARPQAAEAAAETARHLVRGGHAFRKTDKARSYQAARVAACDALTWVLLDEQPQDEISRLIEGELLPAVAGLLRRMEKRG